MFTFNGFIKNSKENLSIFWPYILILAFIALPWFLKSGYLFFTDTIWGPNIDLDWRQFAFLFNLLIKGLSFIFPLAFLEKIFIIAIFWLVLTGGRRLASATLKIFEPENGKSSENLLTILGLFALFNPFVYDRALYGQFGVLLGYGCLLFVISYLLSSLESGKLSYLRYSSVFSAVALMFSIHFIFLLTPFYILFFAAFYLKNYKAGSYFTKTKFWKNILLSIIIILTINANWLLGMVFEASTLTKAEQGISQLDIAAFQTVGDGPVQTLSNVLFMSGFWGKEQFRYFDLTAVSGWQKSFIFLLPLIIYGLYLSFKSPSRFVKFLSAGLLFIFILAVILAIGIKSTFTGGITMFLYDHLPLYKGLREPQKWVAVIVPIYLFYLTIGANRLKEFRLIKNYSHLSAVILLSVLIMQAPSLLWGFNRQVISTPYPADWYQTDEFLLNNSRQSYGCSDKIVFLPWHMYMSFDWARKIIVNPAKAFFSCPVTVGTNMEYGGIYDNSQNKEGQSVYDWLSSAGQGVTLKVAGITPRYIILAKEVDWQNYAWLNKLDYLHLIKETPTLLIYEFEY